MKEDKASRQIAAVRRGDTTGKGVGNDKGKSLTPTPGDDGKMPSMGSYEDKTRFSVHTRKKGMDISVYGKAGNEKQAKKIMETLC